MFFFFSPERHTRRGAVPRTRRGEGAARRRKCGRMVGCFVQKSRVIRCENRSAVVERLVRTSSEAQCASGTALLKMSVMNSNARKILYQAFLIRFPLTLLAAAAARTRAVQIATLFVMARVPKRISCNSLRKTPPGQGVRDLRPSQSCARCAPLRSRGSGDWDRDRADGAAGCTAEPVLFLESLLHREPIRMPTK